MRSVDADPETRQIVRAAVQGARLFCHRPHVDEAVHGVILTAWVKAARYPTEANDSKNRASRGLTYYPSIRKPEKETDR
jgi:hypothetical protein|uniref:Uncharacterized protein n=1 Tax=Siphoviridae sp. ctJyX12 TaxID=2827840 RepID=A0A8S5SQ25_9CAUD|nr:MAG TPA: hypothetical protein [Siphoviridae sp. ctJyX12]